MTLLNAQGFKKPSEGKAAVYFTRCVTYGSGAWIDIFDGEEYVAYSMGKGYSAYECEPGEHVFWVASENTSWVKADLEAGKVYIAQIYMFPGVMKMRVKLTPNAATDENLDGYNASLEMVNSVPAKVMNMKKFNKRKAKYEKKGFMAAKMEGYKKDIEGKDIPTITPEMAVSEEEFK
jgi:hypothetical protein